MIVDFKFFLVLVACILPLGSLIGSKLQLSSKLLKLSE